MAAQSRKRKNVGLDQVAAELITWSKSEIFVKSLKPGRVNAEGVLSDPAGVRAFIIVGPLETGEARRLVNGRALIAVDFCGCGGEYCEPTWPNAAVRRTIDWGRVLRSTRPPASWIDLWEGEDGAQVVFFHGDYSDAFEHLG